MKEKKHLQRLLVAIIIIIGVNLWIGTKGEIEVKAASLAQPTPINQIFPDSSFAEIMRVRLGKTNVTDSVSQDELNALNAVDTNYGPTTGVNSIEGIQYLNQLNILILQEGNISDIRPLSDLKSLTTLVISSQQISDVRPLSGLTNLTILQINQNQISDISPLSGLINLTNLQINQNQISEIKPLSGLTNITSLNMAQNKINDINSLSGLRNLRALYMSNNNISDISPLSGSTKLYQFIFENNIVSDISIMSHMTELNYLNASNNKISDLSPLKELNDLNTISMTNQQIENTPLNYQMNLVLPNSIKDNTGALVSLETISDNGNYTSPDIMWDLPDYKNQVSYTFNQEVTSSHGGIAFSGTVIQPLLQAPIVYKAIFVVEGTETSEEVEMDSFLKAPITPTKQGYTFRGWYDAPTGGNEWDFTTDKMPANDIMLYAQFSINQYIATLDVDGKTTNQKVDYQQLVEAPIEPMKEGYTFIGWYDAPTGGKQWNFEKDKMPANDITLYAQFRENTSNETMLPPKVGGKKAPSKTKENPNTLFLVAKADQVKDSQANKDKEQTSSLPATGDDGSLIIYLQATGVLFLLAFFRIQHSKSKKVRKTK